MVLVFFFPAFAGDHPALHNIQKRIYKLWQGKNLKLTEESGSPGSDPYGEFYSIRSDEITLGFVYSGKVYTCGTDGCGKPSLSSAREYFHFFMITDPMGKVLHVEITEYAATHGHEVSSQGWLKQFRGKIPGNSLVFEKDIDAISGATKSAASLTFEINMILQNLPTMTSKLKI